jgi:serine acetyltransferase
MINHYGVVRDLVVVTTMSGRRAIAGVSHARACTGVTILKGVTTEDSALTGADAVVTKNPSRCETAVGLPRISRN